MRRSGALGLEDWAGWLGPMAGLMGWVCSEGLGAEKTLVPKNKNCESLRVSSVKVCSVEVDIATQKFFVIRSL